MLTPARPAKDAPLSRPNRPSTPSPSKIPKTFSCENIPDPQSNVFTRSLDGSSSSRNDAQRTRSHGMFPVVKVKKQTITSAPVLGSAPPSDAPPPMSLTPKFICSEADEDTDLDKEQRRQKEYFTLMKRQGKLFLASQLDDIPIKDSDCFLFIIRYNHNDTSNNQLVTDIIKSVTEQKLPIKIVDLREGELQGVLECFEKKNVELSFLKTRIAVIDTEPLEKDNKKRHERRKQMEELSGFITAKLAGIPLLIYAPYLSNEDEEKLKHTTSNVAVLKGFSQSNGLFWFGSEPQQETMEQCHNSGTPIIKILNYANSFGPQQKDLFNNNSNYRFVINFLKPDDGNLVEPILTHLRKDCEYQSPVLIYCGQGMEISDEIYDKFDRVWVTGRPDVLNGYSRMFFLQWAPDIRLGNALKGKNTWEGTVTIVDIITRNLTPHKDGCSSSPFTELIINGKKRQKTDVVPNNLNPRWMNLNWSFPCKCTDEFEFEVYHKKHEEGKISFKIIDVLQLASIDSPFLTKTWKLTPIKKLTNVKGTLTLTMTFSEASANAKKNQHFGIPLKESIQNARAKNQPHVVEAILDQLFERGLDLEGIARIPGDSMNVDRIINIIDSGLLSFSLTREDPFVLMGVLKKYIELLPGRLFCEATYEQLVSFDTLDESVVPLIRKLFDNEEPERQKLASDMFRLCKAITLHSQQNRMDARAVSTAFPILVVPHAVQKDPMRYMMAMQKVPLILIFFINHGHLIFDWKEDN